MQGEINGKGAKDTHLSLAPSKASPILLPPLGSITLIAGRRAPRCGEVTCSDAPSPTRRWAYV